MLFLQICQTKITNAIKILAITILTYFLFIVEVPAQEKFDYHISPFRQCWKIETGKMIPANLASDNESNILLSLSGGKLTSVNLYSGKKNWESELGGEIILKPFVEQENIFVTTKTKDNITIRSISKHSGITNWQSSLDYTEQFFVTVLLNSLIVISKHGEILTLDINNGRLLSSYKTKLKFSTPPVIIGNQIVAGTTNNTIVFLSIKSREFQELKVQNSPHLVSVVNNKYLFWSDYKGNSYLVDLLTRKIIWKFRSGAEVSAVISTKNTLLISSLDNFVYLISIGRGRLLWKKRFSERFTISPYITENQVIITTLDDNSAYIIDLEDGRIVNQVNIEENNSFVGVPIVSGKLIIYPTLRGLVAFTDSKTKCQQN